MKNAAPRHDVGDARSRAPPEPASGRGKEGREGAKGEEGPAGHQRSMPCATKSLVSFVIATDVSGRCSLPLSDGSLILWE